MISLTRTIQWKDWIGESKSEFPIANKAFFVICEDKVGALYLFPEAIEYDVFDNRIETVISEHKFEIPTPIKYWCYTEELWPQ